MPPGGAIPMPAMWPLTRAWYGDRLDPDFRPAPLDRLQRLLHAAAGPADFWRLRDQAP